MKPVEPPEPAPKPVEASAPRPVEASSPRPVAVPLPAPVELAAAPVVAPPALEATESAVKPKKDDTFYDLESLEAEMARLLGRDA